jgi:hypothetical protein
MGQRGDSKAVAVAGMWEHQSWNTKQGTLGLGPEFSRRGAVTQRRRGIHFDWINRINWIESCRKIRGPRVVGRREV